MQGNKVTIWLCFVVFRPTFFEIQKKIPAPPELGREGCDMAKCLNYSIIPRRNPPFLLPLALLGPCSLVRQLIRPTNGSP